MRGYLASEQISTGKPAGRWARWLSMSSNVSCDWQPIRICATTTLFNEVTTLGCTRLYSVFTRVLRKRALCPLRRYTSRSEGPIGR